MVVIFRPKAISHLNEYKLIKINVLQNKKQPCQMAVLA